MSRGLNRIGMEEHALLFAYLSDLRYRLDRSHLVVREHYAHERRVFSDRVGDLLHIDDSVRFRSEERDLEALLFELGHGVKDRVVLDVERDKVLFALRLKASCSAYKRLVVGLGSSRCEVYLVRFCRIDARCDDLPGSVELFLRALSVAVQAVRIAVEFIETFDELVPRRLAQICRSGVICIYSHFPLRIYQLSQLSQ